MPGSRYKTSLLAHDEVYKTDRSLINITISTLLIEVINLEYVKVYLSNGCSANIPMIYMSEVLLQRAPSLEPIIAGGNKVSGSDHNLISLE